ncbi:hypothetical protein PO002_31715 [Cupriavidus necator]|uniref:hypothetical protein n=1 Tax=Cupriavidus necator TaxID=106590 RepID=UPI0039C3999C
MILSEFSESADSFFDAAEKNNVNRFLCVLSAITGLKKEGVEAIHDSLKYAAARLGNSKRRSSWLWVEPPAKGVWPKFFGMTIGLIFQKIGFLLKKKGEEYKIEATGPMLEDPITHNFLWHDPHKNSSVKSSVVVMSFKSGWEA